jgi:hypothetical protein
MSQTIEAINALRIGVFDGDRIFIRKTSSSGAAYSHR